jgi:hypothetical protein
MAKKSKKHETEQFSEQQTEVAAEPKKGAVVRKNPLLVLVDSDGNEFKFTHFALPKKAAVAGEVSIDGMPTTFQVTSNKGFTKEDTVINYSWFTLPSGHTGYIAHDYCVTPPTNVDYTVREGTTERKDPARIPKDDVVGALRVEKFKATMAKPKEEAAA